MALRALRLPIDTLDSGPGRRQLERQKTQISRRLRHELDSERIVASTVDAVHKAIRPGRTSVWLVTQDAPPQLARSVGVARDDEDAPSPVR